MLPRSKNIGMDYHMTRYMNLDIKMNMNIDMINDKIYTVICATIQDIIYAMACDIWCNEIDELWYVWHMICKIQCMRYDVRYDMRYNMKSNMRYDWWCIT